jgi:penicillin-insensitive murein endopeptidase
LPIALYYGDEPRTDTGAIQMPLKDLMLPALALILAQFCVPAPAFAADEPAKPAFGMQALPTDGRPQSIGFYSKGCMAGAVAIPVDGPDWQVMRLSRNRRWGHPVLISIIEKLANKSREDGWNGLMVGDISQPRGGPMLTGHASHQIGLDADLWFMPMPQKRLTYQEREELSAVSVLKPGTNYVDDRRWTRAHEKLLRNAAAFPDVERILVHPGVKKKLCDTVRGDRAWLSKIRPFYGHHYHFHVRIACQDGSPACKKQADVAKGDGCDASLDWWFKVALAPKKPRKDDDPEKPKRPLMVSDLPPACASIVKAPARPAEKAEYRPRDTAFVAPPIEMPAYDPARALASRPIEASAVAAAQATTPAQGQTQEPAPASAPLDAQQPTGKIPVPEPSPVK